MTAVLALGACTSSHVVTTTTTSTNTRTQTITRSSTPTFTPPRPHVAHALPPGTKPHKGEKDGACPYIRAGLNVDDGSGVNMADLEGDRIYRTTVITTIHPVGCRFYFYAPPYEAIAEIRPYRLSSPLEAHNAMVLTARTGRQQIPEPGFVRGVDGICFQTRFFSPDGARDWAFVFAKGRTMVIVYTQRTDTSRNALYIGKAIAGKF